MEFNYRATDDKPPLTFTPPPNFCRFPNQPLQGDMEWGLNGTCHMEGPNSAIEMSQFMWRELEKEKIREEIRMESVWMQIERERIREEVIVDEIVRRRILEADVRRELSIERELALRGGGEFVIGPGGFPAPLLPCEMVGRPLGQKFATSLDGRLGMPSVLRRESGGLVTGLQKSAGRHISDGKPLSGNGKQKELVVLPAKPLQDEVNVCALSSACSEKRQLKEEWSCALCHVTASCEQDLNVHLQGKRHKAKEAGLRKKRNNFKIGWSTESPPSVSSKDAPSMGSKLLKKRDQNSAKCSESGLPSQDPKNAKEKDYLFDECGKNNEASVGETKNTTGNKNYACKFWCKTCQVGVATCKDMEEHSAGTKHLAQLLKSNQNTQLMQEGQKLNVAGKDGNDSKKSASEASSAVVHNVELDGQQEKEADIDSETSSVNPEKSGDPLISQQLGNQARNGGTPIARTQKNKKHSFRFWCNMCQIGTDTEKVLEIHRTGKKHLACKKQMSRFWCDVCQVGADTEKVMEIHKAGKKHLSHPLLPDVKKPASEDFSAVVHKVELEVQQEKEADIVSETSFVNSEKSGDPLIIISQQLGSSVRNSGTPILWTQENNKNSLKFWCDMCQIGTDTEKVMEIHRTGKKHLACKKQMSRFWCDVCQVGADTEKVMEIHKAGKKHLSQPLLPDINQSPGNESPKFSMQPITGIEANSLDTNVCMKKKLPKNWSQISEAGMKKNEAPVRRMKKTRALKKDSFKFWCEMCHVGADSKEVIEAHWYGKKHQKLIESLVGGNSTPSVLDSQ